MIRPENIPTAEPTAMTPEQIRAFVAGAEALGDYFAGRTRFQGPIEEFGTPPQRSAA